MTWRERWQVCAESAAAQVRLRELAAILVTGGAREINEPIDFLGQRAWIKGSALHGSGARRHGLAHLLGRRPPPRIAEYRNLAWLREQGFSAPRPLAAAVRWCGLAPRYQVLVTAFVDGCTPFADHMQRSCEHARPLLTELGREAARMHSLHFVHHDLYFRNLLVIPFDGKHRVVLLDAWSGGRFRSLRGPSYDLACLYSDCAPVLEPSLQVHLLDVYIDACREYGRPVDRGRLIASIDASLRSLRGAATGASAPLLAHAIDAETRRGS